MTDMLLAIGAILGAAYMVYGVCVLLEARGAALGVPLVPLVFAPAPLALRSASLDSLDHSIGVAFGIFGCSTRGESLSVAAGRSPFPSPPRAFPSLSLCCVHGLCGLWLRPLYKRLCGFALSLCGHPPPPA